MLHSGHAQPLPPVARPEPPTYTENSEYPPLNNAPSCVPFGYCAPLPVELLVVTCSVHRFNKEVGAIPRNADSMINSQCHRP